jgi:hypothetical protein
LPSPAPTLLVLAAALLGACTSTEPTPSERERLGAAVRLWEESGASAYHYEFRFLCGFCPEDFGHRRRITVEGGVITEVADLIVGAEVPVDERSSTIPRLFQDIADVIAANPYQMSVTYHPTLGYPTAFLVDLRRSVQEDEFGYEAENMVVLIP